MSETKNAEPGEASAYILRFHFGKPKLERETERGTDLDTRAVLSLSKHWTRQQCVVSVCACYAAQSNTPFKARLQMLFKTLNIRFENTPPGGLYPQGLTSDLVVLSMSTHPRQMHYSTSLPQWDT
jgi:hypothetical protein